jgi:hypothetical protein
MKPIPRRFRRSGNVIAFTLLMIVSFIALLAFTVDLGYLYVANAEMQRTADAAALSGAWELLGGQSTHQADPTYAIEHAEMSANRFTGLNYVGGLSPTLTDSDTRIGQLTSYTNPDAAWNYADPTRFNAVRIRVRKTAEQNREVPFFFARAMGFTGLGMETEATAVFLNNFKGFQAPSDNKNLDILPFALDQTSWDELLAGNGADNWTWDAQNKCVVPGPDGILEVNLYPQGTGSPGNRGTVDIGGSNNSTADIARQISSGISPDDMNRMGGKLEFDDCGELFLNGDTGISAGVKDELTAIRGNPRIVPIFKSVAGPGNNATYTIVQFAGVRIMEVVLTGKNSSKRVMVQPATVIARGGIPGTTGTTSQYVYSPVWLVR